MKVCSGPRNSRTFCRLDRDMILEVLLHAMVGKVAHDKTSFVCFDIVQRLHPLPSARHIGLNKSRVEHASWNFSSFLSIIVSGSFLVSSRQFHPGTILIALI